MYSKIRKELNDKDREEANKQSPKDKLKQALKLSDLCFELKKAINKNAIKKALNNLIIY